MNRRNHGSAPRSHGNAHRGPGQQDRQDRPPTRLIPLEKRPYDFGFLPQDTNRCTSSDAVMKMLAALHGPGLSAGPPSPAAAGAADAAVVFPTIGGELRLAAFVKAMRQWFRDAVSERFDMEPPRELLNRWLLDMLATETSASVHGVLLRCPARLKEQPDVVARELLLALPYRVRTTYESVDYLVRDANAYKKACKAFLDRISEQGLAAAGVADSADGKDAVAGQERLDATEEYRKLRDDVCAFNVDLINRRVLDKRLMALVGAVQGFVVRHFAAQVAALCNDLADYALRYSGAGDSPGDGSAGSADIAQLDSSESFTVTVDINHKTGDARVVVASPLLYTSPLLRGALERVDLEFLVSDIHYMKLRELYRQSAGKAVDREMRHFKALLFILLRRYHTFFGIDRFEGTSFHAAAPEWFFRCLSKRLGVTQECFASPLNCFYAQFCSAFPDVDPFFGSRGSFFDCVIEEGAFQCGPPYTAEVMDRTALRIVQTLERCDAAERADGRRRPVLFVINVPEWRTPPAEYHLALEASAYTRYHFCAPGGKHFYVCGDQHTTRCSKSYGALVDARGGRFYTVPHGTHVYIVANDSGYAKYLRGSMAYTEEAADELLQAMMNPLSNLPLAPVKSRDYVTGGTAGVVVGNVGIGGTEQAVILEPPLKASGPPGAPGAAGPQQP